MRKELQRQALSVNRAHLRKWLEAAKEHGTIYYIVEKVSTSGMSRCITLYTMRERDQWDPPGAKASLDLCWPNVDNIGAGIDESHECWCVAARDMHFSLKKRCFEVSGCGMDMVFALIEDLARIAGIEDSLQYTNDIRREGLSRYESRR